MHLTPHRDSAAPSPLASTRIEDYFATVDAALASMSPDEGRDFLERLSDQWEYRYNEWRRRIHLGLNTPAGTSAFDYIETIAGIDQRISTATREACDDLRKWQEAYRKNREYHAAEAAE